MLLTAVTAGLARACACARARALVYTGASFLARGCPCYKKETRIVAALSQIFPFFFPCSFTPNPSSSHPPATPPLPGRVAASPSTHGETCHQLPCFSKQHVGMNYCSFRVSPACCQGSSLGFGFECDPATAHCSPRVRNCGRRADGAGEPHDAVLAAGS